MAEVRLLSYPELEVETSACRARLEYKIISGYYCISATIFDKRLNEEFGITAYANVDSSKAKLEEIINKGVSDKDAKFLRLIQSIYRAKTQAKYFDRFAENDLTIRELEKIVKLSRANKFRGYVVEEYTKMIKNRFIRVCSFIECRWVRFTMLYGEAGDYRFILIIDSDYNDLMNAIIMNDFGTKVIKCKRDYRNYVAYAIYTYIIDGRTDLFNKWLKNGSEDFSEIFRLLDKNEKEGTLTIYDRELYDFIKSAITMYAIA
jgi:hypothetical protein